MKTYTHENLIINVEDNGRFVLQNKNNPVKTATSQTPNFSVQFFGGNKVLLGSEECEFTGTKEFDGGIELCYDCKKYACRITARLSFVPGANVVVQENSIENYGAETQLLTGFSSAYIDNIAECEEGEWYNKDIDFYICRSKWQAEGQWQKYNAHQLCLVPATEHCWEQADYELRSVGSWSTGTYFPCVIVADNCEKNAWFFETEGSANTLMHIRSLGAYDGNVLALEASGCDETNGGWHYELKSGEKYTAPRAYYGTCVGGFEEAAAELNEFKRFDSVVRYTENIPVVFNDYMDCIWGTQKDSMILPLIDAAKRAGCEVFCVDGGWCRNKNSEEYGLGDYLPREDMFSDCSLQNIIDKIKENGMVPGIWLELDACNDTAYGFKPEENWILKRYGKCVGKPGTYFYNFCNSEVREYLKGIVKGLYDMGIRYIKNDYNQSTGIGCNNTYDGNSPAEGLIRNNKAFLAFIDELCRDLPGLVIENCGSGAMRSDNSTLRHFSLQSTSDQEFYYNNPSIISGSLAVMPPEKAGIWSYPYPAMIDEHVTFELTDEYVAKMADTHQTVFNMITSMMGYMYLSGRIELCDEANFAKVKQAVEIYKRIRNDIPNSRPVYPLGLCNINSRQYTAIGLLSKNKLMLAVYNITEQDGDVSVELGKYFNSASVSEIYTSNGNTADLNGTCLNVHLAKMSAFWIELNF